MCLRARVHSKVVKNCCLIHRQQAHLDLSWMRRMNSVTKPTSVRHCSAELKSLENIAKPVLASILACSRDRALDLAARYSTSQSPNSGVSFWELEGGETAARWHFTWMGWHDCFPSSDARTLGPFFAGFIRFLVGYCIESSSFTHETFVNSGAKKLMGFLLFSFIAECDMFVIFDYKNNGFVR